MTVVEDVDDEGYFSPLVVEEVTDKDVYSVDEDGYISPPEDGTKSPVEEKEGFFSQAEDSTLSTIEDDATFSAADS